MLLSICIPTYNRSESVLNQLEFLINEFDSSFTGLLEIIVSDNSSTDNTPEKISNLYLKDYSDLISLNVNSNNVGIAENLKVLTRLANGDFVWFLSDDDILLPGVLNKIFHILKNYEILNFIFINFQNKEIKGLNKFFGYHKENCKELALNIFSYNYSPLVFISSCIYRKSNLVEVFDDKMSNLITSPLFYSFYSFSKDNVYIMKDDYVIYTAGNASYSGLKRIMNIKFVEFVSILNHLEFYGYDKNLIFKSIQKFLENQIHAHLLYNFFNLKQSIRLYKYYSYKSIFHLPSNIVSFIKIKFF